MYDVLLPVDADDTGHAEAIAFLDRLPLSAPLNVVVMHARTDIDVVGAEGGRVSIDAEDLEVPASVDAAVEAVRERGHRAERELREGTPQAAVLQAIEAHDVEQVVVPTHTRSPVGKFVFGSTAMDILRESPVPVTVVTESVGGA